MSLQFTIVRPDGKVFAFDATLGEDYTSTIATTDHPVESGQAVTDHAQPNPRSFSVRGVVTEAPFSGPRALGQSAGGGLRRVQDAVTFLEACSQKLLLVGSVRLGTFANMLMTSLSYELRTPRSLTFDVSFKQLRIASAEVVTIAAEAPPVADRSALASARDLGQQAATDASQAVGAAGVAQDQSILYSLIHG